MIAGNQPLNNQAARGLPHDHFDHRDTVVSVPYASKRAMQADIPKERLWRDFVEFPKSVIPYSGYEVKVEAYNGQQFNKIQIVEIDGELAVRFSNSVADECNRQVVLLLRGNAGINRDSEVSVVMQYLSTLRENLEKENQKFREITNCIAPPGSNGVIQSLIDSRAVSVGLITDPGHCSLDFSENRTALRDAYIVLNTTIPHDVEKLRKEALTADQNRKNVIEEEISEILVQCGVVELKAKDCQIEGMVIKDGVLGGLTTFAGAKTASYFGEVTGATLLNMIVQGAPDFSNMRGIFNADGLYTRDPANFIGSCPNRNNNPGDALGGAQGCELLFDAIDETGRLDHAMLQQKLRRSYLSENLLSASELARLTASSGVASIYRNGQVISDISLKFSEVVIPAGEFFFSYRGPDWREILDAKRDTSPDSIPSHVVVHPPTLSWNLGGTGLGGNYFIPGADSVVSGLTGASGFDSASTVEAVALDLAAVAFPGISLLTTLMGQKKLSTVEDYAEALAKSGLDLKEFKKDLKPEDVDIWINFLYPSKDKAEMHRKIHTDGDAREKVIRLGEAINQLIEKEQNSVETRFGELAENDSLSEEEEQEFGSLGERKRELLEIKNDRLPLFITALSLRLNHFKGEVPPPPTPPPPPPALPKPVGEA